MKAIEVPGAQRRCQLPRLNVPQRRPQSAPCASGQRPEVQAQPRRRSRKHPGAELKDKDESTRRRSVLCGFPCKSDFVSSFRSEKKALSISWRSPNQPVPSLRWPDARCQRSSKKWKPGLALCCWLYFSATSPNVLLSAARCGRCRVL